MYKFVMYTNEKNDIERENDKKFWEKHYRIERLY